MWQKDESKNEKLKCGINDVCAVPDCRETAECRRQLSQDHSTLISQQGSVDVTVANNTNSDHYTMIWLTTTARYRGAWHYMQH